MATKVVFQVVGEEDNVFAVLTYKTGLAAAWAHNHFITVDQKDEKTQLSLGLNDSKSLESIIFTLKTPVHSLIIDVPSTQKKWEPKLLKHHLITDPYSPISDSDKIKVKDTLESEGQLNSAKFPTIAATVKSVRKLDVESSPRKTTETSTLEKQTLTKKKVVLTTLKNLQKDYSFEESLQRAQELTEVSVDVIRQWEDERVVLLKEQMKQNNQNQGHTHMIVVALTVCGKTVEKETKGTLVWNEEGESFFLEAFGEWKFTEFGIKPYSAF
eukprot:TRINITY_DN10564_c0_g1_i1.p1 TRINITY_DN10564_c0_g1~~TRINITY_DN10564_c0_g1_i1.p1  ORF type:complete len:270 (-),score=50.65 TRINITY_DN10564_c0_g1_i1:131-940(-)